MAASKKLDQNTKGLWFFNLLNIVWEHQTNNAGAILDYKRSTVIVSDCKVVHFYVDHTCISIVLSFGFSRFNKLLKK